jgi:hypothetical protein
MKTTLAILLGLCAGLLANDPTAIIRLVLAFGVGVGCTLLWVDRHAQSERAQRAFLEALVSHGWHMGEKGTPETTALRIALPPKVTP